MSSTLLTSATLPIWRALQHHGYDAHAIFKRAGLDPSLLHQPGERFRFAIVKRLWDLVLRETGDPCFGLKIGQHWHPSMAHALGYAVLASDTLHEAFSRLSRYFKVLTTSRETLSLIRRNDDYLFLWDDTQCDCRISDVEYDEGFAAIVAMMRICAGEDASALYFNMRRTPPPCETEFKRFFRAPIHYNADENSIALPRTLVEAELPSGNIQVARECDRIIDTYLSHLDRSHVAARTRAKLIEKLPAGTPSEGGIARALNLSVRSLQRRLSDEHTTFKQLLDDTRRELALQYIRDPSVTITEMTYLLGYSEPANFSRAFKRWTGSSPSAVRAA
jgi:AraC-like DNA-binding protein